MLIATKYLLNLNADIIIKIFEQINFNFRLINKECKYICDKNNLINKTFIFIPLIF